LDVWSKKYVENGFQVKKNISHDFLVTIMVKIKGKVDDISLAYFFKKNRDGRQVGRSSASLINKKKPSQALEPKLKGPGKLS